MLLLELDDTASGAGCGSCGGGGWETFSSIGSMGSSGLFLWVEDERDLRRLFCKVPFPGAVLLSRTTRFLGAGLVSLLRTGEEGNWTLPARASRLVSRCLKLVLRPSFSFSSGFEEVDAASTLLLVTREAGRGGGDWARAVAAGPETPDGAAAS